MRCRARPADPFAQSRQASATPDRILDSRSPVDAAAAASLGAALPCPCWPYIARLYGQPSPMSCPGDVAEMGQLKCAAVRINVPRGRISDDRRQPEANLSLLVGRQRGRQGGAGNRCASSERVARLSSTMISVKSAPRASGTAHFTALAQVRRGARIAKANRLYRCAVPETAISCTGEAVVVGTGAVLDSMSINDDTESG
jgi:hypothetical protein